MHAEHDLHRAGIVLGEEGLQIVLQVGIAQVQRLEDGDGRAVRRWARWRRMKRPTSAAASRA